MHFVPGEVCLAELRLFPWDRLPMYRKGGKFFDYHFLVFVPSPLIHFKKPSFSTLLDTLVTYSDKSLASPSLKSSCRSPILRIAQLLSMFLLQSKNNNNTVLQWHWTRKLKLRPDPCRKLHTETLPWQTLPGAVKAAQKKCRYQPAVTAGLGAAFWDCMETVYGLYM